MGNLSRMFDRIFFGGGRSEEGADAEVSASRPARPSVDDRARYDSGASMFYH